MPAKFGALFFESSSACQAPCIRKQFLWKLQFTFAWFLFNLVHLLGFLFRQIGYRYVSCGPINGVENASGVAYGVYGVVGPLCRAAAQV